MLNRYPLSAMLGTVASRTGDEMAGMAILLFAFGTSSHLAQGALAFGALQLAAALGGPPLGVWLDRARGGWPLAIGVAIYSAGLGGTALALGAEMTGVAIVTAFAAGLFGPAVTGGWSSRLSHTDAAITRRLTVFDASSYSATGLIGPGLAGLAYATVGPIAPLVFSMGLLLLGAAMAPAAHRGSAPIPSTSTSRPGFVAAIGTGLGAVAGSRRLLAATCSSFVTYAGVGFFTVALPLIGETQFGSAGYGSMLLMVMAMTALLANALLSHFDALGSPVLVLTLATLVSAAGLLTMSLPWAVLVVAGIALFGAGDGPQLAALIQIRRDQSPASVRAQVLTTGASVKITAAGIGTLLAGLVVDQGDVRLLLIAAGLHLLGGAVAATGLRTSRSPVPV